MPVDFITWRERTGLFNFNKKFLSSYPLTEHVLTYNIYYTILLLIVMFIYLCFSEQLIFHSTFSCLLFKTNTIIDMLVIFFLLKVFLLGDIELNAGPKNHRNLKVCHYNVNILPSHNFAKLSSFQAYNALHKFDIICISETFLDSSISSNDLESLLDGYKIIRSDHPMNLKRGGVCIFFKETLPLNILNITQLNECLVVEILYNNKKCYLVTLYRSPNQNDIEFDDFITKFEILIDSIYNLNPYFVIILGDFNAKLNKWKTDDLDTKEGIKIDEVTSYFALSQIISGPTHILANSTSCIDLIFTNHPDLVINSGIHS